MNSTRVSSVLAWVVAAGLGGCAHYPANAPKTADHAGGYNYQGQARQDSSDDLLLLLAFSDGGTRTASFVYGVLEVLRNVTFDAGGKPRRLLDEVAVIASVSGGSAPNAAHGLYGDRKFETLDPALLNRNVELARSGQVFNPLDWPALWSPNDGR